jgi:CheY-like chemotaxis protein
LDLERALAKTAQELAAANSENARFLANVSHDLRNPICGIMGVSMALRESGLTANQLKLTESIRSCAGVLSSLIDDLLASSKLQATSLNLTLSTFDLKACIEEVVTMFKHRGELEHAGFLIELDRDLPSELHGDRARVQQILLHFLVSAEPVRTGDNFYLKARSASGEKVRFVVHKEFRAPDSGMVREDAAANTPEAPRNRPKAGLTTCHLLAQKMGGSAGVELSDLENSYWLEIPIVLNDPAVDASPLPTIVLHQPSALVVEDIDYSAAATEAMLGFLGFRVTSVNDGASALRLLESETYDLVFMDWNIPGFIGPEVTARFRTLENEGHRAVIIATTAYSTDRNRETCIRAGMDAFLAKPLTPEKITSELKRLGITVAPSTRTFAQPLATRALHPTLDLQILQFLSDGTHEGFVAQIARFIAAFEADLLSARPTLESGDQRGIARVAHRLLSHAAAIKCTPIIELAGKLQQDAHILPEKERDDLLSGINREFVVLKETLESLPTSTRFD